MPTTRCTTTAEFFTLNQLAQIDQQILQAKPSERAGLKQQRDRLVDMIEFQNPNSVADSMVGGTRHVSQGQPMDKVENNDPGLRTGADFHWDLVGQSV